MCWIVNFVVPADHSEKIEDKEKGDKYFDLGRQLKRTWDMKV